MSPAYKQWLTALKQRIRSAQIKAALKVNAELLVLYWDLGREILLKEKEQNWGSGFLKSLSNDLKADFPEVKGFSLTNLKYIRIWVSFYLPVIGQQVVDQLQGSGGLATSLPSQQTAAQNEIVPQSLDQLPELFTSVPWGHHLQIITKCKKPGRGPVLPFQNRRTFLES